MSRVLHARVGAKGFTLIEVMITVVIVAILAAVAYPSYIEYVARGHRTQLKAQMQAAQQWMERRYSERYFYGQELGKEDAPTAFDSQSFAVSPPAGEGNARYNLSVDIGDAGDSYVITAERSGTMESDRCGNPTVDNRGVKGVVASSLSGGSFEGDAAKAVSECWR
jgi:type IV pilus assembly protein PilE